MQKCYLTPRLSLQLYYIPVTAPKVTMGVGRKGRGEYQGVTVV